MQYVLIIFFTIIFNSASTSGFEYVLIICSWLHVFVSICKVFMKMFDTENFHKILNYAFLKIQAQYEIWCGCMFFTLPHLKMNVTTKRIMICYSLAVAEYDLTFDVMLLHQFRFSWMSRIS